MSMHCPEKASYFARVVWDSWWLVLGCGGDSGVGYTAGHGVYTHDGPVSQEILSRDRIS